MICTAPSGVIWKSNGNCIKETTVQLPKSKRHIDCRLVLCSNSGPGVCGSDGVTYPNNCLLQCGSPKGTYKVNDGPCVTKPKPPKIDCRLVRCSNTGPGFCGSDGKTYPNKCQLQCSSPKGTKLVHKGPCKPKPVNRCKNPNRVNLCCGSDGITYLNKCRAR